MKLNVFVKPNEQSGASLSQGDRPLVSREGLGRKNGSRADFRFLVLSLKQISVTGGLPCHRVTPSIEMVSKVK